MTVLFVVLIGVAAAVVSAALGAPVVSRMLRQIEPATPTPGLLRGGMWVGVLERLLITGGIVFGMPEVVAVVIAVKGLGRYPELRDTAADARSEAAERFIIGTLASLLWAGVIGALARWAIVALL